MIVGIVIGVIVLVIIGIVAMLAKWYRKPSQGQVLVRTGRNVKVSKGGMMVVPVVHKMEVMDISVKAVEISRLAKDGLVCKDNMRADIKVTFFVRVNPEEEKIKEVAQSIGCARASQPAALAQLFDAKFSDALKSVGKQFDFVELYEQREKFRSKILEEIGTDLNGYSLEDAAIDYLEQTPLTHMDEQNILDAQGIKKITELTALQKILANDIQRNKEKTITQQDVEAREAILEMEKQLAETEEKQKREVANIRSREEAETAKVAQEERLKSERARIASDEEIQVAEQNKQRQVIVAEKNKERVQAVETERVEKDRMLEVNERERVVTLAEIEKEKAIEEERKNIQEVIRERVAIEKTVVDEEEKIKDTRAYAQADREKAVAIKKAEEKAEEALVQQIKSAEAAKQAAEYAAKQRIIEAEAQQASASQEAEAIKVLADAEASRQAAVGLAEAKVIEAKAAAMETQGEAEAQVIEAKAEADAKGIEVKSLAQAEADRRLGVAEADVIAAKSAAQAEADRQLGTADADVISKRSVALEQEGLMEAKVLHEKMSSEAKGIEEKAAAMRKLDGVGKDHEEFKLKLQKEKDIELAEIAIQKDIAEAQATVLGTALESANIDIVGGDQVFFDKIVSSITQGKSIDRVIDNSNTLSTVRHQLLDDSEGETFIDKINHLIRESNIGSDDVKNLSISALIYKMMRNTESDEKKGLLSQLLDLAKKTGLADKSADSLGLGQ